MKNSVFWLKKGLLVQSLITRLGFLETSTFTEL